MFAVIKYGKQIYICLVWEFYHAQYNINCFIASFEYHKQQQQIQYIYQFTVKIRKHIFLNHKYYSICLNLINLKTNNLGKQIMQLT